MKLFDPIEPYRKAITLIVVLGAAATVYVWWQNAENNRRSLIAAADGICEAAGAPFRPEGAQNSQWGLACLKEVRRLRDVEKQVNDRSLDAMLEDLERREGKESADAAMASAMARRAASAAERMEKADAAVENDRTDGGWAAAVNELGGLRDD